jgi:Ca2+-binding EF-hand superfamily protein
MQKNQVIETDCATAGADPLTIQSGSVTYATTPDNPTCYREWTALEGFYWGAVTCTTVGYGDYSAANDDMKGFLLVYIFLALFVFGLIVEIGTRYITTFQEWLMDIVDSNPDDMNEPQEFKLALSFFMILLTVFIGAGFFHENEGWTFLDSFYWSFITSTTIGYGDMSLTKDSSKVFSFFYTIVSTIVFAFGLGNVIGIQEEMRIEKKRIETMANGESIAKMLVGDASGGTNDCTISSGEYLSAYLCEMGLVSNEDVEPVLRRFKELDTDASGFLDKDDLNALGRGLSQARQMSFANKMGRIEREEVIISSATEAVVEEANMHHHGVIAHAYSMALHYFRKLIILGIYLGLGAAVMRADAYVTYDCRDALTMEQGGQSYTEQDVPQCVRQWTWVEGIYWAAVTCTTVGYGDYSPPSDGTKIFVIFYAFIGLGICSWAIFDTGVAAVEGVQNLIVRCDASTPAAAAKLLKYKYLCNTCLFMAVLATGTIFFAANEDWSFIDALYWSFVTSTTVGYGDMSLTKHSSRVFSIFYVLGSNALILACISQAIDEYKQVQHAKRREKVLAEAGDVQMLLANDMDGDAKVSEGEFLATFLACMELVSRSETGPVLKQFEDLDFDNSGFLNHNDLIPNGKPRAV